MSQIPVTESGDQRLLPEERPAPGEWTLVNHLIRKKGGGEMIIIPRIFFLQLVDH